MFPVYIKVWAIELEGWEISHAGGLSLVTSRSKIKLQANYVYSIIQLFHTLSQWLDPWSSPNTQLSVKVILSLEK